MKNRYATSLIIGLVLLFVVSGVWFGLEMQKRMESIRHDNFLLYTQSLKRSLKNRMTAKEKATMALALALARERSLAGFIRQRKIPDSYLKDLIKTLRQYTLYQNVWVQILDDRGISLYRSWTDQKGDDLSGIRPDLVRMLRKPEPVNTVSVGRYDLSFQSMVPVYDGRGTFLGVLEVITHFNSIALQFKEQGIESLVLAAPKFKAQILYPLSGKFLEKRYVANLDADLGTEPWRSVIASGLGTLLEEPAFRLVDGWMFAAVTINDVRHQPIGNYLLAAPSGNVGQQGVSIVLWQGIGVAIFFSLLLIGLVTLWFFRNLRNQRTYYRDIIDAASNIVTVNDGKQLLDANRAFFDFFSAYDSIEAFKQEHQCICDFFVAEEGYLQTRMGNVGWQEYVISRPRSVHCAKITFLGKTSYFLVTASKLGGGENLFSVVLTDITDEEILRQELEKLSVTDPLTGLFNRRYFNRQFAVEYYRMKRNGIPLSLLMFDIDHFKQINDVNGHDTGDIVLQEIARRVSCNLRTGDILCRIGGEEFIIILPETTLAESEVIAERLRTQIASRPMTGEIEVTISIGVSQCGVQEHRDLCWKRADEALYEAKATGRNKVVALIKEDSAGKA